MEEFSININKCEGGFIVTNGKTGTVKVYMKLSDVLADVGYLLDVPLKKYTQ